EQEMYPAELRQKLDIANFRTKPWESAPSVVIPADGTTKTWKFHSENTHDFAFTASPNYRISETDWNGIRVIALCEEQHCSGWQNASAFTAKVIEFYSTHVGMYAYPKMVVCDAQDGMEYPMLTLDGGRDPDYRALLAHEVGHNWFFGMVGSNETYRALLDEGFTQFIDSWCMHSLDGDYVVHPQYKSHYVTQFKQDEKVINTEVYNRYMSEAARGDETIIDQHSDHFNGALRHGGGYSMVYMKTAVMLYNLQYVLGDSLFEAAFSHYFNQWKFCHPYVEDFRNSMIQYTHVDLNWFFDEWLTQGQTVDYGIKSVKKGDSTDTYLVKFKRDGRMQMPIDFTVLSKDGKKYNYYIPNTWYQKKTDATVLPRWIGWDKIRPTYTAKVVIPDGISNVMIDTTHRLADVNMLNNSLKTPKEMVFDSKIYNTPSWEHYTYRLRPDVWYNSYDGIKAGFFLAGDYLGFIKSFDLAVNFNTGIGQSQLDTADYLNKYDHFSAVLNFRTPTNGLVKNSAFYFNGRHIDGLDAATAGFEFYDHDMKNRFFVQYKMMYRNDSTDLTYLIDPKDWEVGKFNNTVMIGFEHPYSYHHGNGNIQLNLRSSALGSDYDYHYFSMNVVNRNDLGKININTRTFAQIGTGSHWASESMLYGAGANPETMMDNKYTRSVAFFPKDWGGFGSDVNHFQAGGGLDLRGYAGYSMPQVDWYGGVRNTYKGTTGYAENVEVEFQELFGFIGRKMPKVKSVVGLATYLFGDIGGINFNYTSEGLAM
ncbi:MAG TPA: M1 family aminopeptidase, partial [Bacteroidia bacterium]|nr:M1 family aminopeptidase [Bacteroidia bacterium]